DLKVVIMGAASVGKTTIIHRYIEKRFQETISTIGASFSLKQWGPYNIALWDTAGEERFSGLSSFYCRGAGAAILAYDLTSDDSFHALRARFKGLLEAAEDDCLVVVVGTKLDMVTEENRAVPPQDAKALARELNTQQLTELPYFETSSLSGHNVDRLFEYIFQHCLPVNESGQAIAEPKNRKRSGTVDL
ncbi:hypothetical protein CAPTEDRAFT_56170, partial [Capitella teleta]